VAAENVGGTPDDSQQIVEVVCNSTRQLANRFHLLALTEGVVCDFEFARALGYPLFQALIGPLSGLEEPGVVDCDGGLTSKPKEQPLGVISEYPGFGMREE
jgi:hypothetical protein